MMLSKQTWGHRYCHDSQGLMLGLPADDQAADKTLPERQNVRNCWTWRKKIHGCDSSQPEKLTKVTDSSRRGCWLSQMVVRFLHEKQSKFTDNQRGEHWRALGGCPAWPIVPRSPFQWYHKATLTCVIASEISDMGMDLVKLAATGGK